MVYAQIMKIKNFDDNTEFYQIFNIITQINFDQQYDGAIAKLDNRPDKLEKINIKDEKILNGIKAFKKEDLAFKLKKLNNPKLLGDHLLFNLLKANNYNPDDASILNNISAKLDDLNFEELYDLNISKLIADEIIKLDGSPTAGVSMVNVPNVVKKAKSTKTDSANKDEQ